jgi:hypothetical protein
VVAVFEFVGENGPLAGGSPLFALGWPLAVAIVAWSVRWTLRADPQSPATDGRALLAAFAVQFGWVAALGWLFGDAFGFEPWMVIVVPLVVFVFYEPETRTALRERVGVPDRYVVTTYAGLAGVVFLLFRATLPVVSSGVPTSALRITAACGVGCLAVAAVGTGLLRLRAAA